MKNYNSRNNELKIKFNNHLQKLTGTDTDFYSAIKSADILELKTVLSDINNLLTYKLTLIAGEWICDYFQLEPNDKKTIMQRIDTIDPNAQGFDIVIKEPIKIIAEVKCNVPVKEGLKFGAMHSKHLIEDVQKLLNGKKQIPNTNDFLKFLFILNVGDRTQSALKTLTKKTRIRVENEERLNRNVTRDKMIILNSEKQQELKTDNVYLLTLQLN